jgi:hypothetical protein
VSGSFDALEVPQDGRPRQPDAGREDTPLTGILPPAPDPLAGIPRQEGDNPRDADEATSIFHVDTAVNADECQALFNLFRHYDDAGLINRGRNGIAVKEGVYLGGSPAWEKANPGVFVPEGTGKLYSRLSGLVHMQNLYWKFNLRPFPHPCISVMTTLVMQEAGDAGSPWHSDFVAENKSEEHDIEIKLVGIVQCSDPADYEGGEFEIYSGTRIIRPEMRQGDMVLFPSFLLHRRLPITRGRRFILALASWGPTWR